MLRFAAPTRANSPTTRSSREAASSASTTPSRGGGLKIRLQNRSLRNGLHGQPLSQSDNDSDTQHQNGHHTDNDKNDQEELLHGISPLIGKLFCHILRRLGTRAPPLRSLGKKDYSPHRAVSGVFPRAKLQTHRDHAHRRWADRSE